MENSQALPPVVADIIAKVSGLSTVLGDVTSIRGDGRMMAWAGKDDYWFWLVVEPATSLNETRRNTFRVLIVHPGPVRRQVCQHSHCAGWVLLVGRRSLQRRGSGSSGRPVSTQR